MLLFIQLNLHQFVLFRMIYDRWAVLTAAGVMPHRLYQLNKSAGEGEGEEIGVYRLTDFKILSPQADQHFSLVSSSTFRNIVCQFPQDQEQGRTKGGARP